jgi:hypothetical protein
MRRLISHDEVDRILSREDEILPSGGFAVSVMEAVRREAAVPPPIPFPWKRALPGLVIGGVVLVLVLVVGVMAIVALGIALTASRFSMSLPSALPPISHQSMGYSAGWIALALLVTFVSVKLSMRLAPGRV